MKMAYKMTLPKDYFSHSHAKKYFFVPLGDSKTILGELHI